MVERHVVCCWDILKSIIWYEDGLFSSEDGCGSIIVTTSLLSYWTTDLIYSVGNDQTYILPGYQA